MSTFVQPPKFGQSKSYAKQAPSSKIVKIDSDMPSDITKLSIKLPKRVEGELRKIKNEGYVLKMDKDSINVYTKNGDFIKIFISEGYPYHPLRYRVNNKTKIHEYAPWTPVNTILDVIHRVEKMPPKDKGQSFTTMSETSAKKSTLPIVSEKGASKTLQKSQKPLTTYKGPRRGSKEVRRNLVSLEEKPHKYGTLSEGEFQIIYKNFGGLGDLLRIGAVGDGSCLLHSVMKNQAFSCPANPAEIHEARMDIADKMTIEYDAHTEPALQSLKNDLKKEGRWLSAEHFSILSRYYCMGVFFITKNRKGGITLLHPPEIPKDAKNFMIIYYVMPKNKLNHFEAVGLMPNNNPNVIQTTFSLKDPLFDVLMHQDMLSGMKPHTHKPCVSK